MTAPWMIAVSNTNCERRATKGLTAAGFETWWPTHTVEAVNRYTKRVQRWERPLYPGYLFVRLGSAADWQQMIGIDGIKVILMTERAGELRPVHVRHTEIEKLRSWLEMPVHPVADAYRVGARVFVVDGPFASFEGVLERVLGKGVVTVAVEIFGRTTPVEMGRGQVEVV